MILDSANFSLKYLIILICSFSSSLFFAADEQYYSPADFEQVEKIDAHVHVNSEDLAFIKLAQINNFRLISINVDYPDFPPLTKQLSIALDLKGKYPGQLEFAGSFSMLGWERPEWSSEVISAIETSLSKGAVAVKIWKNIGMDFRDNNGKLVMVNDKRLQPIYTFLGQHNVPLIGHQGEPKNCWLPISQMTVKNDRQYFSEHPQYHMYLHPDLPSYQDQMEIRNEMLDKNPSLGFVGAHLASIEWSTDELAIFLKRYPNASVDMAARMGQVQYQSQRDINKVRDFFITFQDRILYATDLTYNTDSTTLEFEQEVKTRWLSDWQYLTTDNVMSAEEVEGNFSGLHLPKSVIDKIYNKNTRRIFSKAFK